MKNKTNVIKLPIKNVIGDGRCPRKLTEYPDTPCQMALEAIYATPVDSRGCPWYILDDGCNHCFFAYMDKNPVEHTLKEVQAKLVLPMATVDLAEKSALDKIRES